MIPLRGEAPSAVCAKCHPAQYAGQSASAHANALYPAAAHPRLAALPRNRVLRRPPGFEFRFLFAPEFQIQVSGGQDVMNLPVHWAFGSGHQAITFVSRVSKDWYVEHYPTFYTAVGDFGATPGQAAVEAAALRDAAGVLYKTDDPAAGIAGCFECHSTGPVQFDAEGVAQLTEAGVRCQACHTTADAHARDARKPAGNPRQLSAQAMNEFCGRCHRPPASSTQKIDWNYSWNVRHQPLYLNESRCFQKSGGALTCLGCHDPHQAAAPAKPLSAYGAVCLDCHRAGSSHPPAKSCVAAGTARCVDCHMPQVTPQPPLRFTNHWIGVYPGAGKLKPRR